jgi:hypothetical protein
MRTLPTPPASTAAWASAAGLGGEPKKRPKSSYIRFAASMPNQSWQSDFTHYRLTHPDGPQEPMWRSCPGWMNAPARHCR